MTEIEDFARRVDQVSETLARRKVEHIYWTACLPRTEWLLHRPPARLTPHCGHDTRTYVVDWLCTDDLRVLCEFCAVDEMVRTDRKHIEQLQQGCIACGDVHSLGPVTVPVHLEWPVPAEDAVILRGVEQLVTTPLAWTCPAHDGVEGDLPVIRIKRWEGSNAS